MPLAGACILDSFGPLLKPFCLQTLPGCVRRDGTAKVGDVGMAKVGATPFLPG